MLEGIEMVMFGDNVVMDVELIYLIVIEDGICFFICEGGCIVGLGVVIEIVK